LNCVRKSSVRIEKFLCHGVKKVPCVSELNRAHHKLEAQGRQLTTSEQIARELRSRESDLQEMLSTKETQLSVLRMRLEEADRLLELEKQHVIDVQADRERSVVEGYL
jgi:hypothetical protein